MKKVWSSIFQTVSESVKTLRENANQKARHDVVLMTTGISVVTMLTFAAGELNGNGQGAMVAYAETPVQTVEAETELESVDFEEINDLLIGREHSKNEDTWLLENDFMGILQEEETEVSETEPTESHEEHTAKDESTDTVAQANVSARETEAVKAEPAAETEQSAHAEEKTEEAEEENGEIALSGDEYQVLLRIVQAEAGTCDEDGKLLVANVILNRVEDEEFPDTIRGVVYQKRQFSPVMNGTINTCKITMETRNAVNRALKGEDISDGALYFMNRGKSASRNVRWFDANLQFLFKHGEHEFFK